ncbi:aa3-type cytochrome oxidase subunit CtaJ [Pseudonocardia hydrocarbonoxydans]|uniref:Uncharacterized protein n=1 Tax=Pseudonocardia hydrocarbonoxydans TaxID=76726 RepID=A0A4Y3WJT4_9PSEU|nr:hypothetical protein [Pseudonocardia hydrocarbonoxydans]GEC19113.1 hypothetical protein PHY01_13960 [Pseudonocardia hydrocarbonoxydans]
MDVLVSILWYAIPSIALYLLVAALVIGPRSARRPRYRVGQPWAHEPMWWTANPQGAQLAPAQDGHAVAGERGGARGSW